MDTSETNIKMCKKAWPDLKQELRGNDIVYSSQEERLCIVRPAFDGKAEQYLTTVLLDNPLIIHADDFFIVWSQDQLQAISGLDWRSFDKNCLVYENPVLVPTKEQAGVRVVMRENYNKTWNGEDWIKQRGEADDGG